MTVTHDIVAKPWNLCNVLKDDGVTYHHYVTDLILTDPPFSTKKGGGVPDWNTNSKRPKAGGWVDRQHLGQGVSGGTGAPGPGR